MGCGEKMKFYEQVNLDKVLYERYFKGVKNGTFIEAGAYNGLKNCTCRFFEESMGWKG